MMRRGARDIERRCERMILTCIFFLVAISVVYARKFTDQEGHLVVKSSVELVDPVCMEGLFVHDGAIYQSNGWYGQSALVKVSTKTGAVTKRFPLVLLLCSRDDRQRA
jgi:glutamine cyclotransferase